MLSKNLGLLVAVGLVSLFVDAACEPAPIPKVNCGSDEVYGYRRCWLRADVRLNTVGFLPDRKKLAAFSGDEARFEVHRAKDDKIVFEGTAGPSMNWAETGESLRVADFTELKDEGEYYITIDRTPSRERRPHGLPCGCDAG